MELGNYELHREIFTKEMKKNIYNISPTNGSNTF